jgi:hypothetical protein
MYFNVGIYYLSSVVKIIDDEMSGELYTRDTPIVEGTDRVTESRN